MLVYVISKDGKPLMPCENVIARLLLKTGKAKVKRKEPFTIKLTYDTTEYTQPLTLGVDTGSGTAGFAVANEKNEILYRSEIIVRNDIKRKMTARRSYRNNRRRHNTRYRPTRYLNRKNANRKGRLSPTMASKLNSHIKEIEYIKSILPVTNMVFEVGHFDMAAMQDPTLRNKKIIHWGYRYGRNYGFENTKAKVKYRDNYTCQICGNKSKDHKLQVHHIIYKSNYGSDNEDNLITVCESCHSKIHSGEITINLNGKQKGVLNFASQMNVIRARLMKIYSHAIETFGYITATNRLALNLTKYSHWLDASIIATNGSAPTFKINVAYIKKCVPKGDYKQTRGISSETKLSRGKIMGFRKYDKVMYSNKTCFIMSCRINGKPELMDIRGNKISFSYLPWGKKVPKLKLMTRISARSSWMVFSEKVETPY